MKKSLLYLVLAGMSLTVACSKEDDQQPVSSSVNVDGQRQAVFATAVEPMMRKSCSAANCHNTAGRQLSYQTISRAATDGSLLARMTDSRYSCTFDPSSREVLMNWIALNSRD